MTVEARFSHPLKTCGWAKKQIAKFEQGEEAFFKRHPYKEWSYLEFITGQMVHGVEFPARPPERLEEAVYRAVGDLRNALDQAVYAAAKSLGVERPKWTNFPVADSEKEFGRRLCSTKGQYRDIPNALYPLLTSFEPFWPDEGQAKGNRLLRALTEMANPNKHQVPLGIECQTGMRLYCAKGAILSVGTKWDWKGRTELYRTVFGEPFELNMQIDPRIAFGEVSGMAGKPVTRTLREMLPLVQGIIAAIKAETERLTKH